MNCKFCSNKLKSVPSFKMCLDCKSYFYADNDYAGAIISISSDLYKIKLIYFIISLSEIVIYSGSIKHDSWYCENRSNIPIENEYLKNMSEIEMHKYLTKFAENIEFI